MNLSEFTDLSEITVLYMVFFNPSVGKKILILFFLKKQHNLDLKYSLIDSILNFFSIFPILKNWLLLK